MYVTPHQVAGIGLQMLDLYLLCHFEVWEVEKHGFKYCIHVCKQKWISNVAPYMES